MTIQIARQDTLQAVADRVGNDAFSKTVHTKLDEVKTGVAEIGEVVTNKNISITPSSAPSLFNPTTMALSEPRPMYHPFCGNGMRAMLGNVRGQAPSDLSSVILYTGINDATRGVQSTSSFLNDIFDSTDKRFCIPFVTDKLPITLRAGVKRKLKQLYYNYRADYSMSAQLTTFYAQVYEALGDNTPDLTKPLGTEINVPVWYFNGATPDNTLMQLNFDSANVYLDANKVYFVVFRTSNTGSIAFTTKGFWNPQTTPDMRYQNMGIDKSLYPNGYIMLNSNKSIVLTLGAIQPHRIEYSNILHDTVPYFYDLTFDNIKLLRSITFTKTTTNGGDVQLDLINGKDKTVLKSNITSGEDLSPYGYKDSLYIRARFIKTQASSTAVLNSITVNADCGPFRLPNNFSTRYHTGVADGTYPQVLPAISAGSTYGTVWEWFGRGKVTVKHFGGVRAYVEIDGRLQAVEVVKTDIPAEYTFDFVRSVKVWAYSTNYFYLDLVFDEIYSSVNGGNI